MQLSNPFATASPPVFALRIGIAVALGAVLLWGGMQSEDPLSGLVHTDKMRHVVGFGSVGLFAALFFARTPGRLAMLALSLAFALGFELAQGVLSVERDASWTDLASSVIGIFAGYGFGMALLSALDFARDLISPAKKRN